MSALAPSGPNSMRERHRAWLHRRRAGAKIGSWRPKRIYRCAARRWLTTLDNQFQQSTWTGGLSFFRRDPQLDIWAPANWKAWPHLSLSSDCGSDGFSAAYALEYGWGVNMDKFPDQSHGGNCDFYGALQSSQLYGFMLCMLVSWNVPYGPDRDHHRLVQMREALASSYRRTTPDTNPLFARLAGDIAEALRRNGADFKGIGDEATEAFEIMSKRLFARKQGYRVTLCRFCASLSKAIHETSWWPIDLYERSYLALETDMLGNSALLKKLRLKAGLAENDAAQESGGATSGARLQLEERGELRSSLANSVGLGCMWSVASLLVQVTCIVGGVSGPSSIRPSHGSPSQLRSRTPLQHGSTVCVTQYVTCRSYRHPLRRLPRGCDLSVDVG